MAHSLRTSQSLVIASLVLASALATAPSAARADDSVCANGDILVSATVREMSELEEETLASRMEWSAAFNLSELNLREIDAVDPSSQGTQEISWCTSPNDPKCSPLLPENDPITRTLVGNGAAATVPSSHDLAASPSVDVDFAPARCVVCAGHRERLDRPPEG